MEKTESVIDQRQVWLRQYGVLLAVYVFVTWLTDATWIGDTVGYAQAIVAARFDDFGHFLWYPL